MLGATTEREPSFFPRNGDQIDKSKSNRWAVEIWRAKHHLGQVSKDKKQVKKLGIFVQLFVQNEKLHLLVAGSS